MGTTIPFTSQEYGQNIEKVAISRYLEIMGGKHNKFSYQKAVIFVSRAYPYLAASPDVKVTCRCCGTGLVEVKCTFTHIHKTPFEIPSENNYHISYDGDSLKLKKNASWFTQIQTKLGVFQMKE